MTQKSVCISLSFSACELRGKEEAQGFQQPKQVLVSPLALLPVRGAQWLLRDQPGATTPPSCDSFHQVFCLLLEQPHCFHRIKGFTWHPIPAPASFLHPKDHSKPGLPKHEHTLIFHTVLGAFITDSIPAVWIPAQGRHGERADMCR